MKKLTSPNMKHQKLEEKVNNLEEKISSKANKEDIHEIRKDIKNLKNDNKKVQDEQENKIKEITDQKQKNNSWADIVSKEEAEKEVDDMIAKKAKRKR